MRVLLTTLLLCLLGGQLWADTQSTTFDAARLERILKKQETVLSEFAKTQDQENIALQADRDQKVHALIHEYESFIVDNPNCVYAYILYGKLLRQFGLNETANLAFMKANELDPCIPVVKQQIGNYLCETGRFELALPYFLSATELSPNTALYHYQLGELLHFYKEPFIEKEMFTEATLEKQMHAAFLEAHRLEPQNKDFALRHAQSFFDIKSPSWEAALIAWLDVATLDLSPLEAEYTQLQLAKIYLKLNKPESAQKALSQINHKALQAEKKTLEETLKNTDHDIS